MKLKTMIYALSAFALAACSNDDNFDNQNGPVELRLTSGLEVQTRAFQPTQSTAISKDEVVSVWVDDAGYYVGDPTTPLYQAVQLTANGKNGFTGTPMYFPPTGNSVNIYAMHGNFTTPFSAGTAFPGTDGVAFSVAADQSGMGAAYTNSDLLYASEQNVGRSGNPTTVNLNFYHMLSKLELAIKVGNGAPQLAAQNAVTIGDVVVDGTFKPTKVADLTDQTTRNAMVAAGSTTTSTMTLGQQLSNGFEQNNVIYNEAIIVPQNMSFKILKFKLKDGGALYYEIPANTIFESGKKYIYHITLNLTGLEVNAQIVDWVANTPVDGNAEMGGLE